MLFSFVKRRSVARARYIRPSKRSFSAGIRPWLESLDERVAPSATHFYVKAPMDAQAGSSVPVLVAALDDSNHLVENYTGTAHFTSSDSAASLPADYPFTANDHGYHQFQATLNTAGAQTLTATDTNNSSLTGTANINVDAAPVATHFAVQGPDHVLAGTQF